MIVVCYGTRPQIIKASRVLAALREAGPVVAVDTGQHYDFHLHGQIYEQLGVGPPDRFLGVGSGTHAEQTAAILTRAAAAFQEIRPRAVVVIGDTNSTLGAALAAAQLQLPVVHVEAGLRAADRFMAEDINRRLVDAVSAALCAPSERAARQLASEGLRGTIHLTGDVARDVLLAHAELLAQPVAAPEWPLPAEQPFVLATLHRAELVDGPELPAVLRGLGGLDLPVVLPAHPRLALALKQLPPMATLAPNVRVIPPLGYLDALRAVSRAAAVVTDSGGLQREAYWLGTPCVTVRAETEWPETVEAGANRLVAPGAAVDLLPNAVASPSAGWDREAYGDGWAAARIRDIALETMAR